MRSSPIRVRLTVMYFVFFALASLLLGITSWLTLRHSLQSTTQHELQERADDVEAFLNAEPRDRTLQDVRNDLVREYSRRDEGKYLQVVDQSSNLLYFSERHSLSQPLGPFPTATGSALSSNHLQRGRETFTRPMMVHGLKYQVSAAINTKKTDALLRSFLRSLLVLTPALLILAALGGYVISRKALSPVAELAAAAREINDRNLSTRLPLQGSGDELDDLADTLNQMLARIDAAFNSVRDFTANASHELRTPIALIRTRVEIALCFPRTATHYQSVLFQVQASVEQMTFMLDGLLSLARSDAGAEQMTLQPVEMNGLLERVSREWQGTAAMRKLNFATHSCELPVWINGEAIALSRLLNILLDNAFNHTPEQGCIDLGLKSSGGIASVSVADTGSGIAAKDLPHIFERFYRAEPSGRVVRARGGRPGSGLGLSLATWIAERHQTRLSVESAIDRGSVFRFCIATINGPQNAPENAPVGN